MHEIITLQLGPTANFTGIHFFNALESYFTFDPSEEKAPTNHDISFFAGQTPKGEDTFLPRTLIYDLKSAFGTLRKVNALYEVEDEGASASLWDKEPVVLEEPKIEQSAYQKALDEGTDAGVLRPDTVQYWSDYTRVFFHPRSLNPIPLLSLPSPSKIMDNFALGRSLFQSLSITNNESLVESDFRHQVEAADNFQGVNIVAEMDSGWAGFATEYLRELADEYGKKELWVWGLESALEGLNAQERRNRGVNLAASVPSIVEYASLYLPLVTPPAPGSWSNADYTPGNNWHSSAVLAAAIETALFPTRADRKSLRMSDIASFLKMGVEGEIQKRNIIGTTLGFADASELLLGWDQNRTKTAGQKKYPEWDFSKLRIYRTVAEMNGAGGESEESETSQTWNPPKSVPLPEPTSYPSIFKSTVTHTTLSCTSAPVMKKMDYLQAVTQAYVEVEEREELYHQLSVIKENYKWDTEESDEEWDD